MIKEKFNFSAKFSLMNLELLLTEESIIQKSDKAISTTSSVITKIRDIKPNTQKSIQGTCVELRLIGFNKHQFCKILDDDGK